MTIRIINLAFALFILQSCNSLSNSSESISIGERIIIHSDILGDDREIYIHEPQSSEELENLPVVFVLDAYSQFNQTVSTIDYLSAADQGNDVIPKSIVVGITNPNRDWEMTPFKGARMGDQTTIENTGGGPVFLDYITKELIPYIDSHYSTCNHRTIIGHSLGGLLIFQALLNKREYFDNYLVIDPAIGYGDGLFLNEVYDSLRSADLSDEHLFFSMANNRPTFMAVEEMSEDTTVFLKEVDKPNLKFFHTEEAKDWRIQLHRKNYEDETHFSVPFRATLDALYFFFDYYHFKVMADYFHPLIATKDDLVPKLKEHYQNISKEIGCELKPLESHLNAWVWSFPRAGRDDLAKDVFKYCIELYPGRSSVYNNYGNYLRQNGMRTKALEQYNKSLELKNNVEILKIKNELIKEIKDYE